MKRVMSWLLAVVVAAPAFAASVEDSTRLRYKFKPGEKLHYATEQNTKMTVVAGGQNLPMEISQTTDVTWEVVAVDQSGKAKIKHHIDRIHFKMDGPTGKEEYDSQGGKSEGRMVAMMAPLFQAITAGDFTVTMDASGRTSDFELSQKLKDAMKSLPQAGQMGQMFSEESLKKMSGGIVLPSDPVGKSKSWTDKNEMKMPFGKMVVETECTLEGPARFEGREVEKIGMKPKTTLEADENGPFTAKLKEQEGRGTAYFDRRLGQLVGTEMTQTMKMEMSVAGQDISQTMEQKVSMKLKGK